MNRGGSTHHLVSVVVVVVCFSLVDEQAAMVTTGISSNRQEIKKFLFFIAVNPLFKLVVKLSVEIPLLMMFLVLRETR